MTIDLMTGALIGVGFIVVLNLWLCLGLIFLYLSDAKTDSPGETILLSLVFLMTLLGLLIEAIDSKLQNRGE